MKKRQLILFLKELSNEQLQSQILDLYQKFKPVREYYDFSFNPNEEKKFKEARQKIEKEYFPEPGKKVRKRRSIAQKLIRNFIRLEADSVKIADLMLYNIEIAQTYYAEKAIRQEAFYKSMFKSYQEAIIFISTHYLIGDFHSRIKNIVENCHRQEWSNKQAFIRLTKTIIVER